MNGVLLFWMVASDLSGNRPAALGVLATALRFRIQEIVPL